MKKALKKGIACTLGAAMIFSLTACEVVLAMDRKKVMDQKAKILRFA